MRNKNKNKNPRRNYELNLTRKRAWFKGFDENKIYTLALLDEFKTIIHESKEIKDKSYYNYNINEIARFIDTINDFVDIGLTSMAETMIFNNKYDLDIFLIIGDNHIYKRYDIMSKNEILKELKKHDKTPSNSTFYRNINILLDRGVIIKYTDIPEDLDLSKDVEEAIINGTVFFRLTSKGRFLYWKIKEITHYNNNIADFVTKV